jgi:hypothetical protein
VRDYSTLIREEQAEWYVVHRALSSSEQHTGTLDAENNEIRADEIEPEPSPTQHDEFRHIAAGE